MRKERLQNSIPEKPAAIGAEHLIIRPNISRSSRDVLAADDIDIDEKRAILASWASDIFAIDSVRPFAFILEPIRPSHMTRSSEALKTLDLSDRQGRGAQVSEKMHGKIRS